MIRNFTNRKDALKALRWRKVRENKIVWILFCLSILSAFICPILINIYCDVIFYPISNAILDALSNISFGYLTGFLVYLLGSFLPSTKKEIEIKDSIYFNLYMISENLNLLERKIVGNKDKMNYNDYVTSFYNYLVTDTRGDNNYKLNNIFIKKKHFDNIKYLYTFIDNEIKCLIMSYGREMLNSEVEKITRGSQLYSEFIGIKDCDFQNPQELLVDIIAEFASYWHLFFRYICEEYEEYKYCDYQVSILEIDFKKEEGT